MSSRESRRVGLDTAAVIEAAAALVDSEPYGWEHLNLGRLAAQLGVRTPSLYNHISGLEGLRRDLALRGLRELSDRLRWAGLGKSGDEGIAALAAAYRAFAEEHPGLYAATQHAPDPNDAELDVAATEVVRIVLAMLAPYGLGDDLAIHAVRILRSLLHGFVSLEAIGGFGMPLDIDDTFRYLVTLYLAGLHRATDTSVTGMSDTSDMGRH